MPTKKFFRILSIDGGGLRGIIPGQILVVVEELIKKIKNNPKARIADYFDLIAGTSTGGILTCAYLLPSSGTSQPKFSASEVVQLYIERGDDIFSIPIMHKIRSGGGILDEKYPAEGLEKALYDYFGDAELKDLLKPCLITAYDVKHRQGIFFNSTDAKNDNSWNYKIKDVARATSAAPTYFECAKVNSLGTIDYPLPLIDGGVFVNNPTLCAYAEVRNKYQFNKLNQIIEKPLGNRIITASDMAILSLGTGYSKAEYDYQSARDWGLVEWIKPLIDIMMSGVSEVVDYQLQQMFLAVNKPDQYLRINENLPQDVSKAMDDATYENLIALQNFGNRLAKDNVVKLQNFIQNYL